jgi:hypothetical protein
MIVAGATVAVTSAVVGGLGWKSLKSRKVARELGNSLQKKLSAEEIVLRKQEIRARMMGLYDVPKAPLAKAVAEVTKPEIVAPEAPQEPLDIIKLDDDTGLTSVSRMRVVEIRKPQYKAPEAVVETVAPIEVSEEVAQPEAVTETEPMDVIAPMFWDHFLRNIRRPEGILLEMNDFENRPTDLARGYHRATLNDTFHGILHVTKGNISFVYYIGDNQFAGISSAASRFGGKGMQNLTAKQAKDFLNGR